MSFIEKVDRKSSGPVAPAIDDNFLEEGSPTMVEKGMDPSSVFEMCDDDDDAETKKAPSGGGAGEGVAAASPPSGPESAVSLRHRRRGRSQERADSRTKRESWIDPPEEHCSTTLTQAEMESCMHAYEVGF